MEDFVKYAQCESCPLHGKQKVISKTLNKNARLIILGEGPGGSDEIMKDVFSGKAGMYLSIVMERHDIRKVDVYRTTALLCRGDKTLKEWEWRQAVACCRPRLAAELALINTKYVAALGQRALQTLTDKSKIFDNIGTPLNGIDTFTGYKFIACLNPAFILRTPQWGPVFEIHFTRAWALANNNLPEWKWPNIIYEPNEEMLGALHKLRNNQNDRIIAVDVETADKDYKSKLLDIGFSNKTQAISVPWFALEKNSLIHEAIRNVTKSILSDISLTKVLQNGQFDSAVFAWNNLEFSGTDFDTLLAHAVVAPRLKHSLDIIGCIEFHAPRWKIIFKKAKDDSGGSRYLNADPIERAIYNARDCYITRLLYDVLLERLYITHNGLSLFEQSLALTKSLALPMRLYGVRVDASKFEYHRKLLSEKKEQILGEMYSLAIQSGFQTFSPTKDVRKFFQHLGIKSTKLSQKTGQESFDAKVLTSLCAHPNEVAAKMARAILVFRRYAKLLATYIEGLNIDESGRIHPTWNTHGTRTGRWSSQEPNVMNIPKPQYGRNEVGEKIIIKSGLRDLFQASEGKYLVSADYSALEARIIALISGDKILCDWFLHNVDVHIETAKILFKTNNPTSQQRELAKKVRYGYHYGSSTETAWRSLIVDYPTLPMSFVGRLFKELKSLHPGISSYQNQTLRDAREKGYVECPISGRRHHFHGQLDPSVALNVPIQGSAADVINPAALRLNMRLTSEEKFIFQIHDDLTLEGPDFISLGKKLKEEMEREIQVKDAKMIFPVDLSYGKNWGEMKHLEL